MSFLTARICYYPSLAEFLAENNLHLKLFLVLSLVSLILDCAMGKYKIIWVKMTVRCF